MCPAFGVMALDICEKKLIRDERAPGCARRAVIKKQKQVCFCFKEVSRFYSLCDVLFLCIVGEPTLEFLGLLRKFLRI